MPVKKKDHSQSVVDLLREQLGGIKISDLTLMDHIPAENQLDFRKFCASLHGNPYFDVIINTIVSEQINYSVLRADNYDKVSFGRATCNGAKLVQELIGTFGRLYEAKQDSENETDEIFDRAKPFASSDEMLNRFKKVLPKK